MGTACSATRVASRLSGRLIHWIRSCCVVDLAAAGLRSRALLHQFKSKLLEHSERIPIHGIGTSTFTPRGLVAFLSRLTTRDGNPAQ